MQFSRSLLLAVVLVASFAVASAASSCAACTGVFAPVTGEDGLPYINRCVAQCSGTQVAAGAPSHNAAAAYAGRSVSSSVMKAHAAEGFRFINFDRVMLQHSSKGAATAAPSLSGLPADRIVRYSAAHGAIYASAAAVAASSSVEEQVAAVEEPEQAALRKLQQQPAKVADSAAVGQLLTYGEKWRCTATLVGERTVVTAASCVFDRQTGAFARSLYFVLGRNRAANGEVVAPHGASDVAEVFVLSSFIKGGDAAEDIAVVRLQSSASAGKAVSFVSAAPAAAAQQPAIAASRRMLSSDAAAASFWTAGYPNTAKEGAKVVVKCSAQQQAGALVQLGCQTHPGQAGAPLYSAQGQLRGIVTGVTSSTGVVFTQQLVQSLVKPFVV